MIYAPLSEMRRYEAVHPLMAKAIAALESFAKNPPGNGRNEIEGELLFANVQTYSPKAKRGIFEAHRKYIDLQFLLEGEEKIDVEDISRTEVSIAYDPASDYEAHTAPTYSTLRLKKFDCAVLFPEDVHRPGVKAASDTVRKIVVKIAV
jgi:YhcH/YjgK/YiaL family protein